jgi:hypothetical protein
LLKLYLLNSVPLYRKGETFRFFDGIGECYGSKSILEEGVDVTLVEDRVGDLYLEEQGRRLLPTGEAPVHILDDFNEDSPENRSFLIRTCDPS